MDWIINPNTRGAMLKLVDLGVPLAATELLAITALKRSACGAMDFYISMIRRREADLWLYHGAGFALIGQTKIEQGEFVQPELVVYALEGSGVMHYRFMESLKRLARLEGCDSISCQTRNSVIKAFLIRHGFHGIGVTEHGFMKMRLDL